MSNVARSLSILGQRKFGTLFIVQFGGALNDNVLRNAVVAMITFGVLSSQSEQSRGLLIQLTLGLFMLPFFLFQPAPVNLPTIVRIGRPRFGTSNLSK